MEEDTSTPESNKAWYLHMTSIIKTGLYLTTFELVWEWVHFLVILNSLRLLLLCTYLSISLKFKVFSTGLSFVHVPSLMFTIVQNRRFFYCICRSKPYLNVYIQCSPILSVHFILINHIIQCRLKVYQYFSIYGIFCARRYV